MSRVDEIKQRLDIVEVISNYLALSQAGKSMKALCPFHVEQHASFFVFPERQTWRCFGTCGDGGDLFSFVMKMENLSFSGAIQHLAPQAGVNLGVPHQNKEQNITQLNEIAREYFSHFLESTQGISGQTYLQQRNLRAKTIKEFEIGMSPRDGKSLADYLLSKGFSEKELLASGLASRTDRGYVRDLFRGRLMFPIRDGKGQLVGFGARSLDNSSPKYLNSPKTATFDKGHLLYGLPLARESIRQRGMVVIVEGYMDVLTSHQSGSTNVVASMGTSLTTYQTARLHGLASTVVLALDSDTAGQEAILRSLESVWQVFQRKAAMRSKGTTLFERFRGPELRIAVLPSGKDPDDLIREDYQEWENCLDGAVGVVDYLFSVLPSRFDLDTPDGKAQVAQLLYPLVAAQVDSFQQDHYFRKLSQLLGVSESTLEASVGRPTRPTSRQQISKQATIAPFKSLEHDPLEEHCMALLLQFSELQSLLHSLVPEHFQRVVNRAICDWWGEHGIIEAQQENIPPEFQEQLHHLLELNLPPLDYANRKVAFTDCVRRLEGRYLRNLKMEEELLLTQVNPEEILEHEEGVLTLNQRINNLFLSGV